MAYELGKLVRADNSLNIAVGNALRIDEKAGTDNRTRIQRNSMMEAEEAVSETRYNGNFNLVNMTYTRDDGSIYQGIEICGRNVNWENVANHKFTNLADPSYYYVNGEKKQYEVYKIYTQTGGVELDVKYYVYFYYYSSERPEYLMPIIHRNVDISIDDANEYLKQFNTSTTEEPSNILLLGSFRFNSDGTTEVTQIFRDEGIPAIYVKGSASYSGPFMVKWRYSNMLSISCPPEYMGGSTSYCGSICAPDMQIIGHIGANNIRFTEGQENTLLALKIIWDDEGIKNAMFEFVPDPWKTCSDETKLAAVDYLNPKTEKYPYRDPYIAIYPIARIEGKTIVQLQQGHIIDYNRWWRV